MSPDAIAIRNAAEALLVTLKLAGQPLFKTVSRIPVEFEPDDDLPGLIVAVTREQMSPDGDANSGEIRFINDITLSIFVSLSGNKRDDSLDDKLSLRSTAILNALLRDDGLVRQIEGFERVEAVRTFRKPGERFFADSRTEVTVRVRSSWGFIASDDLQQIDVTARPFAAGDETPPVIGRWILPTSL